MAMLQFGEMAEEVVTRSEFSLGRAREAIAGETIAVLGYGVQGPAQALNLRDNGFQVIVGQRAGTSSHARAVEDGWKPGETLFSVEEAAQRGTFLLYLLSDAGQIQSWSEVRAALCSGKTLGFSHGFGVTFHKQTGIVPPLDVDVILVAPKGSGTSVRQLYLAGKGINSSFAVYQNVSGRAREKALAWGIGVGSGYLFETTFEREVRSDLVGERGVLMGAIAGLMEAQYELLRTRGHTPSEAFNETVEEATQSLYPFIGENGMEWLFQNCSTTAQRGALDWKGRFKKAVTPLFEELYRSVESGQEAEVVVRANSAPDYRERLSAELTEMANQEMWQAGRALRKLRP